MESEPISSDAPGGREGLGQTRREKQTWGLCGGRGGPNPGTASVQWIQEQAAEGPAFLLPRCGARPQAPTCSVLPSSAAGSSTSRPWFLSLGLSALPVTPNQMHSLLPTHSLWVSACLDQLTNHRLEKHTCCRLRH